jgi:chitodextrinase
MPEQPPGWPAPTQVAPDGVPPAPRTPLRRRPRLLVAVLAVIVLVAALVIWAPWVAPGTPTQVQGTSATATSVVVRWTGPSGHTGPSSYLILRDGNQVGSVPSSQTSYTDGGLRPGHSYNYSVVARSWLRRSAPAQASSVRTLTPSPTRLTADRATANSATSHWSAPANSPAPDSYEVLRDGNVVRTVDTTSYKDVGLSPATSYRYEVVALWDGNRSDPSGPLAIKTATPPLSAARLTGSALPVKVRIVANGVVTNLHTGQTWTNAWDFTPRCASGPCAVDVSGSFTPPGFGTKTFKMTLVRHGAVYSGTTRAQITYCSSAPVTDTVRLRITVKKAGAEGTEWLARSWTGTLSLTAPFTTSGGGFCPGGSLDNAVSG